MEHETRTMEMPTVRQSAENAGLRYVSDDQPGIRRKKWGRGFTYLDPDGNHVTDENLRERIEELVIPPAWTDVWICPDEDGHVQATGRDDDGRKQYIYHPAWEKERRRAKFDRLIPFGESLPKIRAHCRDRYRVEGLPREKILAVAVGLLDRTLVRVGHDRYARKNDSYGVTTLQDWQVSCDDNRCTFEFEGKSGQEQHALLDDPELAEVVDHCREVPGSDLLQYYDGSDTKHTVQAEEVNQYLKEVSGRPLTAKDFRTWGGTVRAAVCLNRIGACATKDEGRQNVMEIVDRVAEHLGNTRAVCRKYYIHPDVIDAYLEEHLLPVLREQLDADPPQRLAPEEHATLQVLRYLRS